MENERKMFYEIQNKLGRQTQAIVLHLIKFVFALAARTIACVRRVYLRLQRASENPYSQTDGHVRSLGNQF